jgi:Enoyl-CoA hydratase/isomerase
MTFLGKTVKRLDKSFMSRINSSSSMLSSSSVFGWGQKRLCHSSTILRSMPSFPAGRGGGGAAPASSAFNSSHRRYISSSSSSLLKETYENILVEKHGDDKNVALITLNRPKVLNALNSALFQDLLHATKVLDDDDSIRCIVLTGSSKAFAAGVYDMLQQYLES